MDLINDIALLDCFDEIMDPRQLLRGIGFYCYLESILKLEPNLTFTIQLQY